MRGRVGAALLLCGLLTARTLTAQITNVLAVDLSGAPTRFTATDPAGAPEALSGMTLAGHGALSLGIVSLEGTYLEGRLDPDSGSASPRDIVEAALFLAVRPRRWLVLKAGPHLRAYVQPAGTERWVLGEGRVRLEGALVGSTVRTHVELWHAFSADVNVGSGDAAAQGGEAGLTLRLPRVPFWGRLTYAIDQATIGTRTETVEAIGIAVGYGGR